MYNVTNSKIKHKVKSVVTGGHKNIFHTPNSTVQFKTRSSTRYYRSLADFRRFCVCVIKFECHTWQRWKTALRAAIQERLHTKSILPRKCQIYKYFIWKQLQIDSLIHCFLMWINYEMDQLKTIHKTRQNSTDKNASIAPLQKKEYTDNGIWIIIRVYLNIIYSVCSNSTGYLHTSKLWHKIWNWI